MLYNVKKQLHTLILLFAFLFFVSWWILLVTRALPNEALFEIFSDSYGILAFLGGFYGLAIAKKWGGFSSYVGKAVLFLSLGLLAQGFGQIVYSIYYLVLNVEVPYPSLGDIGYFGSIPLYVLGVWFLGKAAGLSYRLKSKVGVLLGLLIPILLLAFSYRYFLFGYNISESGALISFFDFGYPLGQSIYLSLAIVVLLLSSGTLGGHMRPKTLVLLSALFIQYLADFVFLYQVNRDIWEAGKISDFLYLIAYFAMFIALTGLDSLFEKLKSSSK